MTSFGSWGYFQQGSDQLQEVDELGSWLSTTLHCAVHYPAFGKRIYECRCGVLFPAFIVQSHDVESILNLHAEGHKPDKIHYKE